MSQYFQKEILANQVVILSLRVEEREMNVLSESVLRELDLLLDELATNKLLAGVVFISGREDHFVVGADISEIKKFKTAAEATAGSKAMQGIYNKIAALPCATVAAIHGTCLGGGTELSLACTWRVVSEAPSTKLGLPEIQLGLLPGAGGTQRLPRLIGLPTALDMILTGKQLDAKRAFKAGLVDAVVPKNQLKNIAIEFARKKRNSKTTAGKNASLGSQIAKMGLEGNFVGRMVMQSKAKEMAQKSTKGFYPAAFKAIEAVFTGFDMRLEKGLEVEAKLFGELAATRESKSLIHLFDATTAIKKHRYKAAGKERFGSAKTQLVGVVGAGFMGAGIATVCADRKLRVRLSDPSKDSVGRALKQIKSYFDKKVFKRRLKDFEAVQRFAHISPGFSPVGFGSCDVVIEAVFEDLHLKQKILGELEKNAQDNWIFASNTSALPISDIAATSSKPERVIGMHFFSPVDKMPLLEIVLTSKTADWVVARCIELGQSMGKQVIVVKDGPGFYTTRALSFFLNEAAMMLKEGAKMEAVDHAITSFGFPVGPITLIDEVGIDVGSHVLSTMEKAYSQRIKAPESLKSIIDSGRLGRKNHKGFYEYEEGEKKGPDEKIYALVNPEGNKSNIAAQEMIDRCLLVFINESVRCLEDGVLFDAYSGDVGAVFGLGFPPFWGGPFKYCDHLGARVVVERLQALAEKYGERFKPASTLLTQAAEGKSFY